MFMEIIIPIIIFLSLVFVIYALFRLRQTDTRLTNIESEIVFLKSALNKEDENTEGENN